MSDPGRLPETDAYADNAFDHEGYQVSFFGWYPFGEGDRLLSGVWRGWPLRPGTRIVDPSRPYLYAVAQNGLWGSHDPGDRYPIDPAPGIEPLTVLSLTRVREFVDRKRSDAKLRLLHLIAQANRGEAIPRQGTGAIPVPARVTWMSAKWSSNSATDVILMFQINQQDELFNLTLTLPDRQGVQDVIRQVQATAATLGFYPGVSS